MAASIIGARATIAIPLNRDAQAQSEYEQQVLDLAREALKTPLSDDEQGFIEMVERQCAAKSIGATS